MKTITYNEAIDIVNDLNNKDKIQFFLLKLASCPFCDEWLKNNLKEVQESVGTDFDMYAIECDTCNMPFPPPSSPTSYFYHKKFIQPFIRQGFMPAFETCQELKKFIRIKNGESYESVFK